MRDSNLTSKNRTLGYWIKFAAASSLVVLLAGCGGSDGSAGSAGAPGAAGKDVDPAVVDSLTAQVTALTQAANPETCVTCHAGTAPVARSGPMHQAKYKELYQDGVVKIVTGSMAVASNGVDTTTLTFQMTKNGAAFDCTKSAATFPNGNFAIGSYWATYDPATKTFPDDLSLMPSVNATTGAVTASTGSKAYDAVTGVCTIKKIVTSATDKAIVAKIADPATNGIVQLYGTDEIDEVVGSIRMGKYPFAGVLKVGTVDYSTAANVSGCENCHTQPFLKHAYIYGTVTDNAGAKTEFYTCKGCHYDQRTGGHQFWQILRDAKDAPATAEGDALRARVAAINAGAALTDAEKTKYAYKAKLMNDVHMSHAMEFAYPQSMKNCVTCHAGKLDIALADDKFKAETCKSCHSVDGLKAKMSAAVFTHSSYVDNPDATDCTICHKTTGGAAPTLKTIHNGGYDTKIYSTTGVRYSDTIVAKIDSVSLASNKLTIKFSATGTVGSLSATAITPTVLVGLYGYDTKDFLVAAHGSTVIDGVSSRNLEYVVGTTHPRFTTVTAANGSWEVTADLSLWADKIAAGTIKRAEIAVLPGLKNPAVIDKTLATPGPVTLGLNAPSRTFDLGTNAFDDTYFKDIVKVANTGAPGNVTGCNTCHDQLATTFHSGDRGGNIKVCRICHEVSSAGSHLELQSRSIDSYVHAIHSFQFFDPGDVKFSDPFESMEYSVHIGTQFPRFGILNCESCHNTGMYNVPNQAKSMPGVLSGTDVVADRSIGSIPPAVTGPAVRACGGCHRAQVINKDDSAGLATLTQHWKTFGYVINTTSAESRALWESVVAKIMALFK